MFRGNKGEWSELYTFIKLLADGKLFAADSELNKLKIYYPLIKIIREESDNKLREFINNEVIKIVDGETGSLIEEIKVEEFIKNTKIVVNKIKKEKGTFNIPEIEEFLNKLHIKQLKSKSIDKRDITLVVHDLYTGMKPKLGFSIKSQLGNPSTLFNSNRDSTNFIYKITGGITDEEIDKINSIETRSKIRKRIDELYNLGYRIEYFDTADSMFKTNLQLIDSSLPRILAEVVKYYFLGVNNSLDMLEETLNDKNPCGFNLEHSHNFYEYKLKNFLMDTALGMTASTLWTGEYDATGGYIIVREDGELVCYHLYNMNEFKDYLFYNTKLESPSSSRHGYGSLYKDNGSVLLKLNLQIRFKK